MSYSLIDIPKENYSRTITNTTPLYVPMGALSAADATTLRIGVVVGAFAGVSAAMTLEESVDAGSSWTNVTGITADVIGGTGTFEIAVSAVNGPLSPLVRLKILPDAITTIRLTSMFRTFVQSNVMIPRDITVSGAIATEATLLIVAATLSSISSDTTSIDGKIDTVNTNLGTINTSIGTVNTNLGTINTSIGTVNTSIGLINTQITNFDRNSGAAGATTLRSVLATRHEAVATPLSVRLGDGTDFLTCGAIAAAQKTVATATKALDTVSLALGWDGTNHTELLLESGGRTLLATRHETVTTPLALRLSDGTDFLTCGAIAAAQKTISTATKALDTVSLALGYDGVNTHREILVDTNGALRIAAADLVGMKPEYSAAFVPVLRDFSSTGLTANTWSQYIASTSAKATLIQYVNESGYPIELGFGAGGAEVSKIIMSQSGELLLLIPAGTRLALRCTSNVSTGNFWISALV